MRKYIVYPTKSIRGFCPTICSNENQANETLAQYAKIFPRQCWKIKVENK